MLFTRKDSDIKSYVKLKFGEHVLFLKNKTLEFTNSKTHSNANVSQKAIYTTNPLPRRVANPTFQRS